jgi:hypothetical protein
MEEVLDLRELRSPPRSDSEESASSAASASSEAAEQGSEAAEQGGRTTPEAQDAGSESVPTEEERDLHELRSPRRGDAEDCASSEEAAEEGGRARGATAPASPALEAPARARGRADADATPPLDCCVADSAFSLGVEELPSLEYDVQERLRQPDDDGNDMGPLWRPKTPPQARAPQAPHAPLELRELPVVRDLVLPVSTSAASALELSALLEAWQGRFPQGAAEAAAEAAEDKEPRVPRAAALPPLPRALSLARGDASVAAVAVAGAASAAVTSGPKLVMRAMRFAAADEARELSGEGRAAGDVLLARGTAERWTASVFAGVASDLACEDARRSCDPGDDAGSVSVAALMRRARAQSEGAHREEAPPVADSRGLAGVLLRDAEPAAPAAPPAAPEQQPPLVRWVHELVAQAPAPSSKRRARQVSLLKLVAKVLERGACGPASLRLAESLLMRKNEWGLLRVLLPAPQSQLLVSEQELVGDSALLRDVVRLLRRRDRGRTLCLERPICGPVAAVLDEDSCLLLREAADLAGSSGAQWVDAALQWVATEGVHRYSRVCIVVVLAPEQPPQPRTQQQQQQQQQQQRIIRLTTAAGKFGARPRVVVRVVEDSEAAAAMVRHLMVSGGRAHDSEVVPGSEALPLEDSMHERLLRGLPFINALQAFRIARGLALRQPGEGATEVFEHDTAPASPLRLFLRSWRQGLHPLPPPPPPRARAARTVI